MTDEVLMPALSPTMEEGKLAKWLVKEGDEVKSGDVIAEIETDKATMEVEAVDEGTVGKILVAEGTEGVKVNTPIAVIVAEARTRRDARERRPRRSRTAAGRSAAAASRARARRRRGRSRGAPSSRSGGRGAPTAAADETPEMPEGTEMVKMTVREALRDAMAEEMRRDADVFLMGEEVAEYQGAYKVTQGLLDEFGAAARGRHADHRARLRRPRRRRGHGRA